MLQNFIFNIFSNLFALLITFSLIFHIFPDFLSFCIHVNAAGLRTESVLVSPRNCIVCKEKENGRERQGGWRRIMRAKRGGGRREGESGVCVDKKRKKARRSLSLSLSLSLALALSLSIVSGFPKLHPGEFNSFHIELVPCMQPQNGSLSSSIPKYTRI